MRLARLVIAVVSSSATVRVSPMVAVMSVSQVAGFNCLLAVSGTDGSLAAIVSARVSSEDATSTRGPLTVLL